MNDPDRAIRVDVRLRNAIESGTLPKELLIVGPAGTGKTFGLLTFFHTLAADFADLRIPFCRQTRASLTESVMVTFEQEVLPRDGMESVAFGASRRTRQAYNYPNNSTIVLWGLDHPERILSTAWDVIYLNEAIEGQEDAWDTLGSRLNRPGRPSWMGYLIGDTNPGDPSHWLKRRIDEGRTVGWDTAHEANPGLHDGTDWTPEGRLYMERLDRLKGARHKRLKRGLWAASEGAWFDSFGDDNVTTLAEFDPAYDVHLAVDSGVHTGAVWFQIKPVNDCPRGVSVFGDYYAFDKPAFRVGQEIVERTRELCGGRIDRGSTDPAGNARNAIGVLATSEYARAGLRLHPWPKPSIAAGLGLIESFVSIAPSEMIVHGRCAHLIEAFANYRRAKRGGQWIDVPEDPQHPYEDVMDALRGGLNNAFPRGRVEPPRRPGGVSIPPKPPARPPVGY